LASYIAPAAPQIPYFCPAMEKLRIDKYLWSIRLFKTRSQAADAIDSGRVKLNGANIKPARSVSVGDQYVVKTEQGRKTIVVTALLAKRVGYEEAIKHYTDITPEEDKITNAGMEHSFFTGKRLSKTGHPTKKQRRDLDDFLNEAVE
jgi:ribosome-associated heat shock protein Hsp15